MPSTLPLILPPLLKNLSLLNPNLNLLPPNPDRLNPPNLRPNRMPPKVKLSRLHQLQKILRRKIQLRISHIIPSMRSAIRPQMSKTVPFFLCRAIGFIISIHKMKIPSIKCVIPAKRIKKFAISPQPPSPSLESQLSLDVWNGAIRCKISDGTEAEHVCLPLAAIA